MPPVITIVFLSGIPQASIPLCFSENIGFPPTEGWFLCLLFFHTWHNLSSELFIILAAKKDDRVGKRCWCPGCVTLSRRTAINFLCDISSWNYLILNRGDQVVLPSTHEMQESRYCVPSQPPQTTSQPPYLDPDIMERLWPIRGWGRSGMRQPLKEWRGKNSTVDRRLPSVPPTTSCPDVRKIISYPYYIILFPTNSQIWLWRWLSICFFSRLEHNPSRVSGFNISLDWRKESSI